MRGGPHTLRVPTVPCSVSGTKRCWKRSSGEATPLNPRYLRFLVSTPRCCTVLYCVGVEGVLTVARDATNLSVLHRLLVRSRLPVLLETGDKLFHQPLNSETDLFICVAIPRAVLSIEFADLYNVYTLWVRNTNQCEGDCYLAGSDYSWFTVPPYCKTVIIMKGERLNLSGRIGRFRCSARCRTFRVPSIPCDHM